MRYCGSVTDQSWTRAVLRLNTLERKYHLNQVAATKVHDEAFNFIYGLKRLPRIFTDEYNQQKGGLSKENFENLIYAYNALDEEQKKNVMKNMGSIFNNNKGE